MTSMPASRNARAMIFAPRSWPSSPGLAISTLGLRCMFALDGAAKWAIVADYTPGARSKLARTAPPADRTQSASGLLSDVGETRRSWTYCPTPYVPLPRLEVRSNDRVPCLGRGMDGESECGSASPAPPYILCNHRSQTSTQRTSYYSHLQL